MIRLRYRYARYFRRKYELTWWSAWKFAGMDAALRALMKEKHK